MSDEYDEDEEECPGPEDCDDPYCRERERFLVEVQRTVTYTINAHSEDEANQIMWDQDVLRVNEPDDAYGFIEDYEDSGEEASLISESEHLRQAQEFAQRMQELEQEEAST